MRSFVKEWVPGAVALLLCAVLYHWGKLPPVLAGVAVVAAWADGYRQGRDGK